MFDLSITKLLVLAVMAIVIFGPDQLPKIASQAGRMLRELRRLAQGATDDLREGLGPEFADFDVTDLHPKNFVRKHLWMVSTTVRPSLGRTCRRPTPGRRRLRRGLAPGEDPPYDIEAT